MEDYDETLHTWYTVGDDLNPYCQLCRELIQDCNPIKDDNASLEDERKTYE